MMRYELVLNKVAPLFYKFANYEYYFLYFNDLLHQYVKRANIRLEYLLVPNEYICRPKDVYYCYNSEYKSFLINGTTKYLFKIMLYRKDKVRDLYGYKNLPEVILDMVINKFVFENKKIECCFERYNYSFKDLFIALVGRDLYEAIRISIK
ncbi:MAG: hypothetical protein RXR31_01870 [Thermoproteota archaeon]